MCAIMGYFEPHHYISTTFLYQTLLEIHYQIIVTRRINPTVQLRGILVMYTIKHKQ